MIFNTTANNLNLDTGAISSAILKSAGSGIQDEVNQKCSNGLQDGEYVTSSGGNLNVNMIFHAALCKWEEGKGKAKQVNIRHFKL